MAEAFEFEIKPKGIDATVRELRGLENQLDGVSDSMDGAGGSSSNMAQKITAGVVAAQAAYAVMKKLIGAVREAADEWERQAGILNRFTGNIDEASRRTNGLITQLDLMTASSRATAAGLTLTADQFATVSVRASEYAAATGGDATAALNSLIGAIAAGRAGELHNYGVDLQGITSITDKQTAAIEGLVDGFGDAESSADTLGGRLAVLDNRMDDLQTEFIQIVEDSGLVEQAFDRLTMSVTALFGEISLFGNGGVDGAITDFEAFVLTGVATMDAFSKQIKAVSDAFNALKTVISNPFDDTAQTGFAVALNNLNRFEENMQESFNESIRNRAEAQSRRGRETLGRKNDGEDESSSPRRRGGSSDSGDAERALAEARAEYADRALESQTSVREIMQEQYDLAQLALSLDEQKAKAADEMAIAEQERLDIMAQQTAETMKQKEATQEAADAELDRQSNMRKAKSIQAGVADGYKGIADITKETIRLTEEGGVSASKAFAMALDEWLKNLAIQEAISGAVAFAEGVGNAVMNTGHSAAKFAESAQHFAIAAVAGGASVAIPNSGGGGGGGGDASRPDASAGAGSTEGGGNTVINYNSPVAEAQLGRDQARANRAAARTFDA